MLMKRQAIASPSSSGAVIGRYRFQLPTLWLLAVALPGFYVYAGFITAESHRAIANSVIGAALASFIGLAALRRINEFPGVRSYAFILPTLATSYGAILVLIFGLRLAYSRSVLGSSFVIAVVTVFTLVYVTERAVKLRFYVVPGGDVDTLEGVEEAEWVRMAEPVVPDDPRAMLVADFRYDHNDEWERLLATAAVGGRIVYHSKLLRESLSGKVTIEHLSENSFGSLLPNLAYRKFKRLADIVLCFLLLPVLLIPMSVIGILIKLDSPGPIIFRQKRVGYRSATFEMFKFRSMRPREILSDENAAREDAMTQNDDNRITRIGRFLRKCRLDELPQILNVLRGEMSWIGPRPEAVPLSKWYESEIPFYSYRHIIRPGISGWAQVQQGHVTDLDAVNQKLAYDFYYVKYFSAWLDMVIVFRTIPTMIGGLGAR